MQARQNGVPDDEMIAMSESVAFAKVVVADALLVPVNRMVWNRNEAVKDFKEKWFTKCLGFRKWFAADQESLLPQSNKSPPQLWSHHKVLNLNAKTCSDRGVTTLKSLNFTAVVRSGTYVYGNSGSNRAAVKCVGQKGESSFLYLSVAGPEKEPVENLRNVIARLMSRSE
ncbi:hypothetical protein [Marinobacter sp. AL4B]|uniref:hypothetical protein n=1 Tax=Marinobacter sp. AL4B TaxID=2871173 RepID=UPI001CAA5847|nr:hypothetical protein [Marinobacter sp. AL4B]MBZ0334395.1 hypothetical protein [Marinobacter sp. AL4B]